MQRKRIIREDEYMQKEGRIVVTNVALDLQTYKIPHRMLEWHVKVENIGIIEAIDRAVKRQQQKLERLESMGHGRQDLYKEVGIRYVALHALERDLGGRVLEIVLSPESLSWARPCKLDEAIEELSFRSKDVSLLIMNALQEQQFREYVLDEERMAKVKELALKNRVPILILSGQEMARHLVGWESREVKIGQSYNLINTYDIDAEPGLMNKNNSIMLNLLQCGKTEDWCNKVWKIWDKKGGESVNNMYAEIQGAAPSAHSFPFIFNLLIQLWEVSAMCWFSCPFTHSNITSFPLLITSSTISCAISLPFFILFFLYGALSKLLICCIVPFESV